MNFINIFFTKKVKRVQVEYEMDKSFIRSIKDEDYKNQIWGIRVYKDVTGITVYHDMKYTFFPMNSIRKVHFDVL